MFNFSVSVVIPVFNEALSINELISEVESVILAKVDYLEFVFINDASSDNTEEVLNIIRSQKNNVHFYTNAKNLGQGHSLLIGIQKASHETIITMDGDLQIDPHDIEKLLLLKQFKKLDFVCSKRKKRAEEKFRRHIPSIMGNFLISLIFNTEFTDIGSSLKILHKKDIIHLQPFRNIHRYLSIILAKQKLTYEEFPVNDRYRKHGASKYSFFKFFRVLFEIIELRAYIKELKK